jgi:hypothetical protein
VAEIVDVSSRKEMLPPPPEKREREIKPLRDMQGVVRNYHPTGQGFLEISNVRVALFKRHQSEVVGYAGLRI